MRIHWLTIAAMVFIAATILCTLFFSVAVLGFGLVAIATSVLAVTEHLPKT